MIKKLLKFYPNKWIPFKYRVEAIYICRIYPGGWVVECKKYGPGYAYRYLRKGNWSSFTKDYLKRKIFRTRREAIQAAKRIFPKMKLHKEFFPYRRDKTERDGLFHVK